MKKSALVLLSCVLLSVPFVARADESRVNLWPLAGYNEGAFDVIWPLGHFKDASEWRFFPVVKEPKLFCVFPEFWFGDKGFAVLPFVSRYDFNAGALFPVVWWDAAKKDETVHSVLPLYFYRGRGQDRAFWVGAGLAGYYRRGDEQDHWFVPFYARAKGSFFSIPYSKVRHGGETTEAYLCGLGGRTVEANGATKAHWFVPLYYKNRASWISPLALSGGWQQGETWNEGYLLGLAGRRVKAESSESWCAPLYYSGTNTFASALWYHHLGADGQIDRWMIPLLLSGGYRRDGMRHCGFLLNVAGYRSDDKGYAASWCAPFYFYDNDDTFVTPLYGYHKNAQWCFPLWYNDEETLMSFAWCQRKNTDGTLRSWAIPLLLSGGGTAASGKSSAGFLLGLGGYDEAKGSQWVAPLWYRDRDSFVSLPYTHVRDNVHKSDTHIILPLLSGCTAYDDGQMEMDALVLYGHGRDAKGKTRFDYLIPLYYYDGPTGDYASLLLGRVTDGAATYRWWMTPFLGTYSGDKSGGWFFPLFNRAEESGFRQALARLEAPTLPDDLRYTNQVAAARVDSKVSGSVLLGADFDHSVKGDVEGEGNAHYRLTEKVKRGNRLFFNYASERKVTYDIATRRKIGDVAESETMALCGLFYRTHTTDALKGTAHTRTHVLWKLWDREETDGNVTLDAFPGFTYDSKTNGCVSTSFLWRFFRYENDPATGTKLDLLFIPVLR